MLVRIRKYSRDEGASAVEYGLLVAAVAALIVLIVFALGRLITDAFEDTCGNLESRPGGPTTSTCTPDAG